jgi:pantoate--beta-alanine ligase
MTSVWRRAGDTIALVPTMGNLHRGHISLVELASAHAEHVIVSVFVNPTQFGPNEDFAAYPRTLELDARRLSRAGVDILFAPDIDQMYPNGLDAATRVEVPQLSEELCGAFRPGHFVGVTSVVSRLINICAPNIAVFGKKDYQQYVILCRMVADLNMPVKLMAGETERDPSGLAKSSRNSFLDEAEQARAAVIYAGLQRAANLIVTGDATIAEAERYAVELIEAEGLMVEYVSVRRATDLALPDKDDTQLVILAAARLGPVRLIDNVAVSIS